MEPFIVDFAPYMKNGSLSASEADMTLLGKSLVETLSSTAVVYVKNAGIALDKVRTWT